MWHTTRSLVRDLEARLEKVERGFKDIDREWTDTYEKLRNLHRRMAKRDSDALRSSQTDDPQSALPLGTPRNPLAFRLSRMAQGGGNGGVLPDR